MTRTRRWLSTTLIVAGVGLLSLNLAWMIDASNDGAWGVSVGAMLLMGGVLARRASQ